MYHDYDRLAVAIKTTALQTIKLELSVRQVHQSKSVNLPSTIDIILTPQDDKPAVQMRVDYRFLPQLGYFIQRFEPLAINQILSGVLRSDLERLDACLQPAHYVIEAVQYTSK